MRYIDHGQGGEPGCMRLVEGAAPVPAPGEILIEVHYAGVNRPDVIQREGKYPPPPGASPVLGLEVAGRIAALGEGVDQWTVGDLVTALAPGGGYAEYCVVPAGHALPVPTGLTLAEAAGLPENWFTVWSNLRDMCRLQAGERLLVHGGSGGIGLAAIQLGKLTGCEVFTTVGSDEKAAACRAIGADYVINYRQADFKDEVRRLTADQGVDVVLDMVGAPYLQKNLSVLRKDGRLSIIAFLQGSKGECDLMPVMLKRLTVTGSTLRPRSVAEKTAIRDALLAQVWPAVAAGQVKSRIHAVFPLAEADKAHELMESSRHIGKILLQVK
ncbi:NAD(P)H-quinone oxidoreductase [Denitratisoma sp. agr-D3]